MISLVRFTARARVELMALAVVEGFPAGTRVDLVFADGFLMTATISGGAVSFLGEVGSKAVDVMRVLTGDLRADVFFVMARLSDDSCNSQCFCRSSPIFAVRIALGIRYMRISSFERRLCAARAYSARRFRARYVTGPC